MNDLNAGRTQMFLTRTSTWYETCMQMKGRKRSWRTGESPTSNTGRSGMRAEYAQRPVVSAWSSIPAAMNRPDRRSRAVPRHVSGLNHVGDLKTAEPMAQMKRMINPSPILALKQRIQLLGAPKGMSS